MRKFIDGNGADSTPAVRAYFDSHVDVEECNFYEFNLSGFAGSGFSKFFRFTDWYLPLKWSYWGSVGSGSTFTPAQIIRGPITTKIGFENQTLDITLAFNKDDSQIVLTGFPDYPTYYLKDAAREGFFDQMMVRVWRCVMPKPGDADTFGAMALWIGNVSKVTMTRLGCNIQVESILQFLDKQVPPFVIDSNNLYSLQAAEADRVEFDFTLLGGSTRNILVADLAGDATGVTVLTPGDTDNFGAIADPGGTAVWLFQYFGDRIKKVNLNNGAVLETWTYPYNFGAPETTQDGTPIALFDHSGNIYTLARGATGVGGVAKLYKNAATGAFTQVASLGYDTGIVSPSDPDLIWASSNDWCQFTHSGKDYLALICDNNKCQCVIINLTDMLIVGNWWYEDSGFAPGVFNLTGLPPGSGNVILQGNSVATDGSGNVYFILKIQGAGVGLYDHSGDMVIVKWAFASGTTSQPGGAPFTDPFLVVTHSVVDWDVFSSPRAPDFAFWTSLTAYSLGNTVVDANGHVQMVTTTGTSGGSAPAWSSIPGTTTSDGSIVWTYANAGSGVDFATYVPSINALAVANTTNFAPGLGWTGDIALVDLNTLTSPAAHLDDGLFFYSGTFDAPLSTMRSYKKTNMPNNTRLLIPGFDGFLPNTATACGGIIRELDPTTLAVLYEFNLTKMIEDDVIAAPYLPGIQVIGSFGTANPPIANVVFLQSRKQAIVTFEFIGSAAFLVNLPETSPLSDDQLAGGYVKWITAPMTNICRYITGNKAVSGHVHIYLAETCFWDPIAGDNFKAFAPYSRRSSAGTYIGFRNVPRPEDGV